MTPAKLDVSARPWRMTGTSIAGAIAGGTIGAFTTGPIGTVVGMLVGAFAASAIERYVEHGTKVSSSHKTSAS